MTISHQDLFEKFARTVNKKLKDSVEKIVLFGSVARGKETEKSDIDVLIVVKDKAVKDKIFDIAYDLMLEYDIYISPKVISRTEYHKMENKRKSFLKKIQPEATAYAKA